MIWNRLSDWLTSPAFLVPLALFVFFGLLWLCVPFALYGLKRRLDRMVALLEDLRDQVAGAPLGPAYGAARADGRAPKEALDEKLFEELRRRMREVLPGLEEKTWDPANVTFQLRNGDELVKVAHASLKPGWVEVSFDLRTLGQAFPQFSAEEFRRFVEAFLHERYGYFMTGAPDGSELAVSVTPHPRNNLDLFVGIIQEKVLGKARAAGGTQAGSGAPGPNP